MKLIGVAKVKDRGLSQDDVTTDLYDSIEVEIPKFRVVMPRPDFLGKDDKEFNITLQYTSSGTFALFLGAVAPKKTDEEADREAARVMVLTERSVEKTKAPNADENVVDENSDEFKNAMKKIKESHAASKKSEVLLAKIDENGELVPNKDTKG